MIRTPQEAQVIIPLLIIAVPILLLILARAIDNIGTRSYSARAEADHRQRGQQTELDSQAVGGTDAHYARLCRQETERCLELLRIGRSPTLTLPDWELKDYSPYPDLRAKRNEFRRVHWQAAYDTCQRAFVKYAEVRRRREAEEVARRAEQERQEALWAETERKAAIERERAEAWKRRLKGPIPLADYGTSGRIIFGTKVDDGQDLSLATEEIPHMLIVGASGSGKSVFMHQLLYQLVRSPKVERMIMMDLKGGIELERYRRESNKVQVIWEYTDVVAVIDELVALMEQRQSEMRENGWQNWPGGRIFVVVDEFAEIQDDISDAEGKDEKQVARQLARNLNRISRRARALGIVLMCALQKATVDAMDSSFRNNLSLRICLRVTTQFGATVLDGLESAPVEPAKLPVGRFIYYDARRGEQHYLQTQIAPNVQL